MTKVQTDAAGYFCPYDITLAVPGEDVRAYAYAKDVFRHIMNSKLTNPETESDEKVIKHDEMARQDGFYNEDFTGTMSKDALHRRVKSSKEKLRAGGYTFQSGPPQLTSAQPTKHPEIVSGWFPGPAEAGDISGTLVTVDPAEYARRPIPASAQGSIIVVNPAEYASLPMREKDRKRTRVVDPEVYYKEEHERLRLP